MALLGRASKTAVVQNSVAATVAAFAGFAAPAFEVLPAPTVLETCGSGSRALIVDESLSSNMTN